VVAAKYTNTLLRGQIPKGEALRTDHQKLVQCGASLNIDLESKRNELTPVMSRMMGRATDVHGLLSGARDSRMQNDEEGLLLLCCVLLLLLCVVVVVVC